MAYCTGGVRCVKLTGWLKRVGFDDFAQLNGGIVRYGKKCLEITSQSTLLFGGHD
jgi:predicted sulfurtransferase